MTVNGNVIEWQIGKRERGSMDYFPEKSSKMDMDIVLDHFKGDKDKAEMAYAALQTFSDIEGAADLEAQRIGFLNLIMGLEYNDALLDKWINFVNSDLVSVVGEKQSWFNIATGGVLRRHVEGSEPSHDATFEFDDKTITPVEFTAVWRPTYGFVQKIWRNYQKKTESDSSKLGRDLSYIDFLIELFAYEIKKDIVKAMWIGDTDELVAFPKGLIDGFPKIVYNPANTNIQSFDADGLTNYKSLFLGLRNYADADNIFEEFRQLGVDLTILCAETEREAFLSELVTLAPTNDRVLSNFLLDPDKPNSTIPYVPIRGNAIVSPLYYPEDKILMTPRQNLGFRMLTTGFSNIEYDKNITAKTHVLVGTVTFVFDVSMHKYAVKVINKAF